jgi:hypothetical protein
MKELEKLRREIDAEIKRIWLEEPEEVKKLFSGVVESGAGSYGQYFTTLVFVDGEVRALGYLCFTSILQAIDDQHFDMDHVRKLSKMLVPVCAEFLGYCGLTKLWDFCRRFLKLVDKADDRRALRALVRSLVLYVNRMHGWIHFYFPWGLGTQFRTKTNKELKALHKLMTHDRKLKGR